MRADPPPGPVLKHPLLPVVLFYAAGVLAARFFSLPLAWLFGLGLVMAGIAASSRRLRPFLLPVLIATAGATRLTSQTAIVSPHDLRSLLGEQPAIANVRATIVETPTLRVFVQDDEPSWRTVVRLKTSAIQIGRADWRPAHGELVATTPGQLTNLFAGQLVQVAGVADRPKLPIAEGTFSYRAYLRDLGIHYQLRVPAETDWSILPSNARPPLSDRFRAWARQALSLGLPQEDESLRLEWALAVGWKTALTEEVSEPFVRAATYHIFAVDGLRMAIIFGIGFGLLRACAVPRRIAGPIMLPVIWFYVALTGWPASAIRASVMLTLVILGWALNRPTNLVNSLFAAALIILLWDARQLFQAGFQLSFFVVLALILILPPMHALLKKLTAPDPWLPRTLHRTWPGFVRVPALFVTDLTLTSFAAWIGSIPLTAYYFNIVTPVSTPANVLAVPLCALVLISNMCSLLLAAWFPAAAEIFNHAGWGLMEIIRVSSQWFADWPRAYWYVSAPGILGCGLYYFLLIGGITGWLLQPRWRAWKISGTAALVLAWLVQFGVGRGAERLFVLPMNGGFAVYADRTRSSPDLLVDCGTTNSVAFGTKPFLRAQGVNRLDVFILSHGDLRHIGGGWDIFKLFGPRQVRASPVRSRSATYRKIIADLKGVPGVFSGISSGESVGRWTVVHPGPEDRFARADDAAVAAVGSCYGTRVLLLSDLGRQGQEILLARHPDLKADIVVAGLPTGSEPLADALLDSLQPRLVIIADSEFPASERASPVLKARLARRGIPVLYTRFSGATTLEFRRRSLAIRTTGGEGWTLPTRGPWQMPSLVSRPAERGQGRAAEKLEPPGEAPSTEPTSGGD